MPFLGGKIGNILKSAPNVLGKVASGVIEVASGENPIQVVKDRLKNDIANSEELTETEKQMALAELEKELDLARLEVEDRKSARKMYAKDNSLQFWFAVGFGVAYILLTMIFIWMSWQIAVQGVEVGDFAVTLISTLFGAMSSKVNTITDFLFGSSQGSKDKDNQISTALKKSR